MEIVGSQSQSEAQLRNLKPFLEQLSLQLKQVSPNSTHRNSRFTNKVYRRSLRLRFDLDQYLRRADNDLIEISEVSKLAFEATIIFTDWLSLNSDKVFRPLEPLRSFRLSHFSNMPMIGAPHPETLLFLMSRGLFVWEVSPVRRTLDGDKSVSHPTAIAKHDDNHYFFIQKANEGLSTKERSEFYDYLWGSFVNRLGQTLREREIAIFILHHAFFEMAQPMSLAGLAKHLAPTNLSLLYGNAGLYTRLTRPNDLSSKILNVRDVQTEEVTKVVGEMRQWLTDQGKISGT